MPKGKTRQRLHDLDEIRTAADISYPTRCIDVETLNSEVFALFDADPAMQSLPVVDKKIVVGTINRERFMGRMAGRFHWEVYSKKRCSKMMDHDPVVVEADTPIREVAQLLLGEMASQALAESFIVSRRGAYVGTGFSSDVLAILLRLEKQAAEELRQHRDHLAELVNVRTRDLNLAKLAAESANLAKSEFLSNMSHELRTPLHAILALSRFGHQKIGEGAREKLGQYFRQINQSAERLSELVNNLLDLASLNSGEVPIRLAAMDLAALLASVMGEWQTAAAKRGIDLRFTSALAAAPVLGDQASIRQALGNVLGNALKFSPDTAEIRIELYTLRRGEGSPDQCNGYGLSITDHGPGIPESELDSIFERFTQSSKTKTGAGGTGLGLAIAREIMRLHYGEVTASNAAHGGACFLIRFPLPGTIELAR